MKNRKTRLTENKIKRKMAREKKKLLFPFDPFALTAAGPIIETYMGVTEEYANAMQAAGIKVPEPEKYRFLIDTGADVSMVKAEVAEGAQLKFISEDVPVLGVGIETTGKVYHGRIWLRFKSKIHNEALHTIWVDGEIMTSQFEGVDHFDGVLGRNFLQHFEMVYNGKTGRVSLEYVGQ